MKTIWNQLHDNIIAIISLIVALLTLSYMTWREESTEKNRTTRAAVFELLKNLGELQIVVNHSFYQPEGMKGNPFSGWGQISLITDLSEVLPAPIPEKSRELAETWGNEWKNISKDEQSVKNISEKIDADRQAALDVIRHLR